MTPIQKRKAFQWIKTLTHDKFFRFMNTLHGKAYNMAVKHYTEAAEIELPPRYQKALHERAKRIREEWDGMHEITLDETERAEFERAGIKRRGGNDEATNSS